VSRGLHELHVVRSVATSALNVGEMAPFERTLSGGCLATSPSSTTSSEDENWYSELLLQHLPACGYWTLMTKQYASSLGPVTYPAWAPALTCTGA